MKTFLTKRILQIQFLALFCVLICVVIDFQIDKSRSKFFIEMAPIIIYMFPIALFKPNWFLVLPYSRKKLLFIHLLETLLMYASILIFLSVFQLYLVKFRAYEETSFTSLFISMAITFGILRFAIPLNAIFGKDFKISNFSKSEILAKIKIMAYSVVFLICLKAFGDEPFIYLGALVFILFGVPYICLETLVMPKQTLLRVRTISVGVGLTSVFIAFSFLVAIIHVGKDAKVINFAAGALGSIPIQLSLDRTKELFADPLIEGGPVIEKALIENKANISFENWKSRARLCENSVCSDLSDLGLADNLNEEQKLEAFLLMMKPCDFKIYKNAYVRCSGSRLSDKRLKTWLNFLVKSGTADRWLDDASSLKQNIAIRSLAYTELSGIQKNKIKRLEDSEDLTVKMSANLILAIASEAKPETGKCKNVEKNCRPEKLNNLF